MQVQSISNNKYYNSTFGVSRKFNKKEYENLKSLRRGIVSGLASDKFNPEKYLNRVIEFAVKFIEFPQERRGLRPIDNCIKEYISNPEIGLRQMFKMWKNLRKTKKMLHSLPSENIQEMKESLAKTFKEHNIEQTEIEKGKKTLAKFFGFKQDL